MFCHRRSELLFKRARKKDRPERDIHSLTKEGAEQIIRSDAQDRPLNDLTEFINDNVSFVNSMDKGVHTMVHGISVDAVENLQKLRLQMACKIARANTEKEYKYEA